MTNRTNPLPDFPANLLAFQQMFPNEAACLRYLEQVRWPDGFVCPSCGAVGEPSRLAARPRVLRCRACQYETTVTAGTIMHKTRTSLHVWFWSAYLLATSTPGMSALEIQKKLGIKRYETAFLILHKLRAGMVRPGRDKIGANHAVELDVAYIGGKHKGKGETGKYRKTKKVPVLVAVEVVEGKPPKELSVTQGDKPGKKKKEQRFYGGRVRLRKVTGKSAETINKFAQDWIAPGAAIMTDGGGEYADLGKLGYIHLPFATYGDPKSIEAWVPLVHLVIGNLKAWIIGTFHGVRKQHLQAYLNEFMFRFNRRFWRASSFRTLLGIGAEQEGPTYRGLYDGDWVHRSNMPQRAGVLDLAPEGKSCAI